MYPKPIKIKDIIHKMEGLQVTGKISGKRIVPTHTKKHAVANLSDETGKILLNLWKDQVDQVKDGDTVYLLAAYTKKEMGSKSLSTREEKIHTVKPAIFDK